MYSLQFQEHFKFMFRINGNLRFHENVRKLYVIICVSLYSCMSSLILTCSCILPHFWRPFIISTFQNIILSPFQDTFYFEILALYRNFVQLHVFTINMILYVRMLVKIGCKKNAYQKFQTRF